MNKKILFGIMSLAALASCTTDDFESNSNSVAESSPIKFEVINNVAGTRAHMVGNSIVWDANDGDLFTLYHGGTLTVGDPILMNGYENATYTANAGEGAATLSTPSMIKAGSAIMVWPVDTTFYATTTAGRLTVKVPALQENIEKNIPYASDVVDIAPYTGNAAYNEAGLNRKYPIYMRPLASQLILHADYANTDAAIKELENDANPIDPITWKGVELITDAATAFTKEIGLKFTEATTADHTRWDDGQSNNAWSHVTDFYLDDVTPVNQLTSKCITDLESAKFLMLPQAAITVATETDGVKNAAVVVNTNYGKVYIAAPGVGASKYNATEIADAWYRYQAAGSDKDPQETETGTKKGGNDPDKNYVRYTSKVALGMAQVINAFSKNKTTKTGSIVKTEPTGAVGNRYVKVLLTHLDMSALHITSDKQLSDAARVWKALNLDDVTVYLDGDANGEFKISQTTIQTINDINGSITGATKSFKVKPCTDAGEECTDIVITGGGKLKDIAFIVDNATTKCNVVLNAGETWKWNIENKVGSVKVRAAAVTRFINKGTLVSDADATLKTLEPNGDQNNVPLRQDGTWNVNAGKIFVQFTVTNYDKGQVIILSDAEYRQDGTGHLFNNWASAKPSRFGGNDELIATVINKGVFATVNGGKINNYGLIKHADPAAKTYITTNQKGGNFNTQFAAGNKMGRIDLPFSNKDEDNISISGAAAQGFVSVTVSSDDAPEGGILNESSVGTFVNYMIVNGGVSKIAALPAQIKYVEIDDENDHEIAWSLPAAAPSASYLGLMVLSPVNIKLGTTIHIWDGITAGTGACYLGADMYVGGTFDKGAAGLPSWESYYGDTTGNFATKYVTY